MSASDGLDTAEVEELFLANTPDMGFRDTAKPAKMMDAQDLLASGMDSRTEGGNG